MALWKRKNPVVAVIERECVSIAAYINGLLLWQCSQVTHGIGHMCDSFEAPFHSRATRRLHDCVWHVCGWHIFPWHSDVVQLEPVAPWFQQPETVRDVRGEYELAHFHKKELINKWHTRSKQSEKSSSKEQQAECETGTFQQLDLGLEWPERGHGYAAHRLLRIVDIGRGHIAHVQSPTFKDPNTTFNNCDMYG